MLALVLALGASFAQDYRQSVDIELVHPAPTCEAAAGVERAGPWEPCVVLSGQLEEAPLVLWERDERVADLVGARADVRVGIIAPVGPRAALTAHLPLVGQWGADEVTWSEGSVANGLLIGDLGVGIRAWLHRGANLGVALRLDARVPIGSLDAWVGERGLRLGPGATASVEAGRVAVDLDASLWARRLFAPEEAHGPLGEGLESRAGAALSWQGGRVQPYLGAVTRVALVDAGSESKQWPLEGLLGTRLGLGRATVDAWLGRGVSRGAGTTTLRLGVAVRLRRPTRAERGAEEPPKVMTIDEDPSVDELPDRIVEIRMPLVVDEVKVAPAAPGMPDEAHAELPTVLLETLRFHVDATDLRPESVPVLERLTSDLLAHPSVGPILLEGHASEEGGNLYNYDLSLARADAIFRHLVHAGVQPRRLVLRGLGEVAGEEEHSLEARRRVEVRWIVDSFVDAADVSNPFTSEVDP